MIEASCILLAHKDTHGTAGKTALDGSHAYFCKKVFLARKTTIQLFFSGTPFSTERVSSNLCFFLCFLFSIGDCGDDILDGPDGVVDHDPTAPDPSEIGALADEGGFCQIPLSDRLIDESPENVDAQMHCNHSTLQLNQ